MVLSMAIVRDRFDGIQVGKAIARLMLVVGVSPCVAPLIGAQFLRLGSWRDMFIALAAAAIVLLVLAVFTLARSRCPAGLRRPAASVRRPGPTARCCATRCSSGWHCSADSPWRRCSPTSPRPHSSSRTASGCPPSSSPSSSPPAGSPSPSGPSSTVLLLGRVAPEQILRVGGAGGAGHHRGAWWSHRVIGLGVWPLIVLAGGEHAEPSACCCRRSPR